MYIIDTESKIPLHIQLYQSLKEDIITHYTVGQKLPSIRKIATLYNLSKTTVESAYSQLYAEGYVESRPKSGYFVSEFHFDILSPKMKNHHDSSQTKQYCYDFYPAKLSKKDFPLKLWKRLFNKAIEDSVDFGSYHDGQGEQVLRSEIAKYLTTSRGVICHENQLIISSSFKDSMALLAKLVRKKYTHFAVENPGYHIAKRVFEEYGYEIEKIGVDKKGLNIDELKKSKAKIVYITPSHQYPTGVTMPIANRLKLLAHIKEVGGLIIEDDYDSELAYDNRPIPSLQGLDKNDSVVYMGTFSKSLSPALRVSYMVLPKHLLPAYKESYDYYFAGVSLTTQLTLALFMQEGHWDRHMRKIRTLNKKKHFLMKESLQKMLGDTMHILAQGSGLAILIHPSVAFDWEKLKSLAEEKSIKLYFAKERCGGEFEAIRMGFGGFEEGEIMEAVEAFCEIWHESILV